MYHMMGIKEISLDGFFHQGVHHVLLQVDVDMPPADSNPGKGCAGGKQYRSASTINRSSSPPVVPNGIILLLVMISVASIAIFHDPVGPKTLATSLTPLVYNLKGAALRHFVSLWPLWTRKWPSLYTAL